MIHRATLKCQNYYIITTGNFFFFPLISRIKSIKCTSDCMCFCIYNYVYNYNYINIHAHMDTNVDTHMYIHTHMLAYIAYPYNYSKTTRLHASIVITTGTCLLLWSPSIPYPPSLTRHPQSLPPYVHTQLHIHTQTHAVTCIYEHAHKHTQNDIL